MDKTNEKLVKKHYKKTKQYLKISPVDKKRSDYILNCLSEHSAAYFREHPEAGFDDFENEYGSPEVIISSVLENESYDFLIRKYNISRLKKTVLIAAVALILLASIIRTAVIIKAYYDVQNSMISYEETIIE